MPFLDGSRPASCVTWDKMEVLRKERGAALGRYLKELRASPRPFSLDSEITLDRGNDCFLLQ